MQSLKMKKEFKVIADLLPNNIRVLDVGCGDGSLMNLLKVEKKIEVRGLELNQDNVQQCINKGLPVIQGNAETELHQFPDQSFKNRKISNYFNTKFWILESKNEAFIFWGNASYKNSTEYVVQHS